MQFAGLSQHGREKLRALLFRAGNSVPQSEFAEAAAGKGSEIAKIWMFAEPQTGGAAQRSFHPAGCRTFATIARLQRQDCVRSVGNRSLREIGPADTNVAMLAKRFYVSGRVQGVGFRFFAEEVAARLGVGGYVKNLFDGRVEVYAIGNEQQLHALQDALGRGPRMATVDRVEERDAEILKQYADGFTIEHDY